MTRRSTRSRVGQDVQSKLAQDQASTVTKTTPPESSLSDSLVDPLDAGGPGLPMVRLPSRFKPQRFLATTRARGARPESLKEIDAHLSKLDTSPDPRERFDTLRELKRSLDAFVMRYTKDNPRGQAANALKKWVDGAIDLRSASFTKGD